MKKKPLLIISFLLLSTALFCAQDHSATAEDQLITIKLPDGDIHNVNRKVFIHNFDYFFTADLQPNSIICHYPREHIQFLYELALSNCTDIEHLPPSLKVDLLVRYSLEQLSKLLTTAQKAGFKKLDVLLCLVTPRLKAGFSDPGIDDAFLQGNQHLLQTVSQLNPSLIEPYPDGFIGEQWRISHLHDQNIYIDHSANGRLYLCKNIASDRLFICESETNKNLITLDIPEGLTKAAISPDGTFIVIVCDRSIMIWNTSSMQCIQTFTHQSPPTLINVNFSPDGTMIGFFEPSLNRIQTTNTHQPQLQYRGLFGLPHPIEQYHFSKNGNRALMTGQTFLTIWDIKTGHIKSLNTPNKKPLHNALLSPDGNFIATILDNILSLHSITQQEHGNLSITPIRDLRACIIENKHHPTALTFTTNENFLLFSFGSEFHSLNIATGHCSTSYSFFNHKKPIIPCIKTITVDADGTKAALIFIDGEVKIQKLLPEDASISSIECTFELGKSPDTATFSPDGNSIVFTHGNRLTHCDIPSKKIIHSFCVDKQHITNVQWEKDGDGILICHADNPPYFTHLSLDTYFHDCTADQRLLLQKLHKKHQTGHQELSLTPVISELFTTLPAHYQDQLCESQQDAKLVFKTTRPQAIPNRDHNCPICLTSLNCERDCQHESDSINLGQPVTVRCAARHQFHNSCIMQALMSTPTPACPLCRTPLSEKLIKTEIIDTVFARLERKIRRNPHLTLPANTDIPTALSSHTEHEFSQLPFELKDQLRTIQQELKQHLFEQTAAIVAKKTAQHIMAAAVIARIDLLAQQAAIETEHLAADNTALLPNDHSALAEQPHHRRARTIFARLGHWIQKHTGRTPR